MTAPALVPVAEGSLRAARERRGLKTYRAASLLRVSTSVLIAAESSSEVSRDLVLRCAGLYGFDPEEFSSDLPGAARPPARPSGLSNLFHLLALCR